MFYIFSGHLTGVFLYLSVIYYDSSSSNISAYATSSNSSEEIRNIFNPTEVTYPSLKDLEGQRLSDPSSHYYEVILSGKSKTGIFAEGGLINENFTQSPNRTSLGDFFKKLNRFKNLPVSSHLSEKQNNSFFYRNSTENKELTIAKTLLPTKFAETGSSLLLGVPEVIHVNGTSSIKPRKGVHYNKIVPRKGVDSENEASHEFSGNHSCLWLSENDCYNTRGLKDLECSCCKKGNTLGTAIQQWTVNCKNCKSENILSVESCKNICCNSVISDIYSVTAAQGIFNNYLNYQTVPSTEEKHNNPSTSQVTNNFQMNATSKAKNSLVSSQKNSKLKPRVTKVPYDVEVMTELLSKDQQKVFVPVIVLLLLLPLIGILIFFLWRRTKEYWDKRYYKRMDFLIDGIYND